MTKEWATDMQKFICVAEACHKGSYSWHILAWLSWQNRLKYPLVRKCDQIINWDGVVS